VGAASSSKQDRSYYKSLYHFNADVELAEYSLPVLANQQPTAGGKGGKLSSGVINATQLPPIQKGASNRAFRSQHGTGEYDEEHPIDENEEEDIEHQMD
jgi:hypothetical protein